MGSRGGRSAPRGEGHCPGLSGGRISSLHPGLLTGRLQGRRDTEMFSPHLQPRCAPWRVGGSTLRGRAQTFGEAWEGGRPGSWRPCYTTHRRSLPGRDLAALGLPPEIQGDRFLGPFGQRSAVGSVSRHMRTPNAEGLCGHSAISKCAPQETALNGALCGLSGAAEWPGWASPSQRLSGPVCWALGAGEGAEVRSTAHSLKTGVPAAAAAGAGQGARTHCAIVSPAKRRRVPRRHCHKS